MKEDFEDGKWYKGKEDGYNGKIVYAKAEKRHNEWDFLYYSEHITPIKGYNKLKGSWYGRNKTDWEDVTQEELKQFLPEGHPDLQNTEPNYEIY